MLRECGVQHCLPGIERLEEGVAIYRSFGTMSGDTYAQLEKVARPPHTCVRGRRELKVKCSVAGERRDRYRRRAARIRCRLR